MKYMRGFAKRAAVLLMAIALIGMNGKTVRADATSAGLDFSQSGSITLTLKDANGTTVTGGALTLYQVATLYLDDGDMAYKLTDAFAAYTDTGTLGHDDVTEDDLASLASNLVSYMSGKSISGTTMSVGSDGTVTFSDLELGLYLIVQTTGSSNYVTISPFVVTLPLEADGEWEYAVDATPKVGTVTVPETEEEEPEEPDEPEDEEEETPVPVKPTLPQTGQLNWPVPALMIGGAVLLIAGFFLKNENKSKRYAS